MSYQKQYADLKKQRAKVLDDFKKHRIASKDARAAMRNIEALQKAVAGLAKKHGVKLEG